MQKYLRAVRVGEVGGVGGAGRAASAVPAAVKVEVQRPSPARRACRRLTALSLVGRQLVVIQGASFEETYKNFTEKHGRLLGFDRFEKHIRHHHTLVGHPAKGREDCVCAKELALDGLFKAGREM